MSQSNLDAKLVRARVIHTTLLAIDGVFGRDAPSPYEWAGPFIRMVKPNEPWHARIIPNGYATYARLPSNQIGDCVLPADGWTSHEIYIRGVCRMSYNTSGETMRLHRFEPGLWETWFGSDPGGDTVPYLPALFADPKDPRWQHFLESGLGEWPPRFDPDVLDPQARNNT